MGEYQKLKLVFTYLENGAGNGIINGGLIGGGKRIMNNK